MEWLKRYGDVVFIVITILYGLTRSPQSNWSIIDMILIIMLVLVAINRIRRMFKS